MLKTVSAIATQIISAITGGLVQFTGPAAGQTRVVTIPDANATMARTDSGQTFTGDQTISGGLTVTGKTKSAGFSTVDIGAFPTASGTPTTVYTFPTITLGAYLVSVQHIEANAVYSGVAVVVTDATSARIAVDGSGLQAILTMSGMNLQVTQNSGGAKTFYATITCITAL